jgi:hypothetical protein
MIPTLDTDGNLPPGVHLATWDEFVGQYGGTPHRVRLAGGLSAGLAILRQVGCRRVYVDGSFVTSKAIPKATRRGSPAVVST